MQKLKKLIFAFLISVMCLSNVSAINRCSTKAKAELNKYASQIKASYAIKEKQIDQTEMFSDGDGYNGEECIDNQENCNIITVDYFEITITNLTDQFYVEVTNDFTEETKILNSSDGDNGIITFTWDSLSKVTNFTFNIYAKETTKCANVLQKTLKLRLPRKNENFDNPICEDIPEFNLCQKFVTYDYMDWDDFEAKVLDYKKLNEIPSEKGDEQNKSAWQKVKDFVNDNKYYFIGGGVAIVAIATGVTITIVVKKRRRIEL